MKLDELKKLVADAFESATEKTIIEKAAVINSKIEEVEAEQNELIDKNAELLKSYKDVVLHTNVKTTSADVSNPVQTSQNPDELMAEWLETHDENGVAK